MFCSSQFHWSRKLIFVPVTDKRGFGNVVHEVAYEIPRLTSQCKMTELHMASHFCTVMAYEFFAWALWNTTEHLAVSQ